MRNSHQLQQSWAVGAVRDVVIIKLIHQTKIERVIHKGRKKSLEANQNFRMKIAILSRLDFSAFPFLQLAAFRHNQV